MIIFLYDKTFEGLLTVIFDAYFRKTFPDKLLAEGEPLPLFYNKTVSVCTDLEKSDRVWKGLQKKLSPTALQMACTCWLSELPEIDILLFRYFCKAIDAPKTIEMNFGDPDVLGISKIWKIVDWERVRMMQFTRFQKAVDGTYFAAFEPASNALPLVIPHFKDRFSDQKWLIYDLKRQYGYYYDLQNVTEVTFDEKATHLITGNLSKELMDKDELLFQRLWKGYFKSIAIKERLNPKLHRQNMPARYWKHLTEKKANG
ncbi:hypothetical protein EZS27_001085 [termite gut metagenome]|uniref:DUF4130 domain-containing protein n=1 Tax=termite gut metagenome TaxID=433724 RepID=A0A5J4T0Q7_9ZZZZ